MSDLQLTWFSHQVMQKAFKKLNGIAQDFGGFAKPSRFFRYEHNVLCDREKSEDNVAKTTKDTQDFLGLYG